MKSTLTVFALVILAVFSARAQSQYAGQTLIEIDDEQISAEEFLRIYHKNNTPGSEHAKAMDDYLDMFINFKLKVIEAQNRGMDTTQAFKEELAHYRSELAKPYLVDEAVVDSFMHLQYNRLKTEINVSHILIKLPENAAADDTAQAWEKAMAARQRILNGESFGQVASEVSEGPSARNKGNIGFISAFKTVYPFENAAYRLDTGEVSMPVRTRFGYHIIRKNSERKAPGKVKVAHIMLAVPRGTSQENKNALQDSINMIYNQLKKGADFGQLAQKHSADRKSAAQGGQLPWFTTGQMVPAFEQAAFALTSEGELSEPLETQFGWHIIQLIDKKGLDSFEDMKMELQNKMKRSGLMDQAETIKVQKLKDDYNFKETNSLQPLIEAIDKKVFEGKWKAPEPPLTQKLFQFADTAATLQELALFIESSASKKVQPQPLDNYVQNQYNRFVEQRLLDFEQSNLENKYPEFKYLMKEYHDGILLFELTDQEVWSKAQQDSTGLQAFYEENKSNYQWPDRVKATLYSYESADALKPLRKLLRKKDRKGYSHETILKELKASEIEASVLATGEYKKDENEFIAKAWGEQSLDNLDQILPLEADKRLVYIDEKMPARAKKLNEARGLITADYQDALEKEWVKSLRAKYTIRVNNELFDELLSQESNN